MRVGSWLAGCLLVTMLGCGPTSDNPPTYPVTGTLTLAGKPVAGADIVFVPSTPEAKAAFGKSDAQGKYTLTTFAAGDGAVSGTYKVKVTKWDGLEPPAETKVYVDAETESEQYNPGTVDVVRPPKNVLPAKYANENNSGLTHTVATTATTFDIAL